MNNTIVTTARGAFFGGAFILSQAASAFDLPPVVGRELLTSWDAAVAAADAGTRPLQIVCIGDSNTEAHTYVSELRSLLQACYGERGTGYLSLGQRTAPEGGPKVEHQGPWEFLRDAPQKPPPPFFALDGIWAQTADPAAAVSVAFPLGDWGNASDRLGRIYDGQQRVRIHYQTGPGLGSFAVFAAPGNTGRPVPAAPAGGVPLFRVNCAADKPGYAVSPPFLADGFRIAAITGKVVLFGCDSVRTAFRQGKPVLAGGALVHAFGKGWGQTDEPAAVEADAYAGFFGAVQPDLITILLGTNDMHNDGRVGEYRQNLTTIVRKLHAAAPGVGVLIVACPEAGQTRDGMAIQFRNAAREVAAETGCAFWSLQDLIGTRSAQWTRLGFFADGLHYNRLGGGLWARLLLRQLGFDINDLKHYPMLAAGPAPGPAALPTVKLHAVALPAAADVQAAAAAVSGQAPLVIWSQDRPAAELRLAKAGAALVVSARVLDPACTGDPKTWPAGGSVELYVSPLPAGAAEADCVRQLVFRPQPDAQGRWFTLHENGKDMPAPELRVTVVPLQPCGYEVRAVVPLEVFGLAREVRQFRLEAAAVTAPAPGAPRNFNRLFAVQPDRGAFRDASQSAMVSIE